MKTASKRFLVGAAFGLICLAPAAEAQAQSVQETELPPTSVDSRLPSIRVGYADLDVSSEAGMTTLADRIRVAVRSVCWQSNQPRELEDVYQCRNESRRDAWRQFERNQESARALGHHRVAAIAVRPVAY
jgi:UrcA family protein